MVVAKFEVLPAVCAVSAKAFALHGANGSKRRIFTVRVNSAGIRKITFYLDGRKLKTLSPAQARHGQFVVRINPRRLSFGAHRVSISAVLKPADCGKVARAAVFVRARPAKARPKFTG